MGNIQAFILILIIHFLADFALQTHEQATKKGESNKWLFYHVGTYTLIWSVVYMTLPIQSEYPLLHWLTFSLFIGIPHFLVDWVTSRVGKPFWKSGDLHNGFVVVGADQVIHYLCLIAVFYFFGLIHN